MDSILENFFMIREFRQVPTEKIASEVKKKIDYLQRQLPWKSYEEIAAIFSPDGDVDRAALKQLTAGQRGSPDGEY